MPFISMGMVVISELHGLKGVQSSMSARAQGAAKEDNIESMKRALSMLQNQNNSAQAKASNIAKISHSLWGRTDTNARSIANAHSQIALLICKGLASHDIGTLRSTLQSIKQRVDSIGSRTQKMLSEEQTVGPFKKKNII